MISYIVNLFMVQTDLKRNNGHSEKKQKTFCVRVCVVPYQLKDCFHVVRRLFIHLCDHQTSMLQVGQ